MRVKLREISAESAEQQSPGWKSTRSGLWNPGLRREFWLSPVRAMQPAPPLQGLYPFHATQGYGRCAASTLGFAASRLQRSYSLA